MAQRPVDQDRDAALERELAALRKDYEALRMDQVRAETELANLERQLDELEREAVATWGTSDAAALEELLAAKRAENEKLVADYAAHVRSIQDSLTRLEQGFEDG